MALITLDDRIVEYTKEMLPAYFDIQYFLQKQLELYTAFNEYNGIAKNEVVEYQNQQMQQIKVLVDGYTALSKDLQSIVMSFLKFDDEKAKFYNAVCQNMSDDVRKSLGI